MAGPCPARWIPAPYRSLLKREDPLKFHLYDLVEPTAVIDDLLAVIDRDPTGIFWS